jgi:hypothetical protein
MKRKDIAIIHWPKDKPSPVLFFDEVIKVDAEFLLVIDDDMDISTEDLEIREGVLSFFKTDPNLFVVYGEEPDLFLVRQKILIMIFPRVVRIGGDINPEEMLRLEKKKRIQELVPHLLKLEETISSFRDLLKFLQADPWCRGLLNRCNMAGPYTLLDKSSKKGME